MMSDLVMHYLFSPGHRAVYVGVHVPLGRESKRRHRHRGHKHHRKKKEKDSEEGKDDGRESPSYGCKSFLKYLYLLPKPCVFLILFLYLNPFLY